MKNSERGTRQLAAEADREHDSGGRSEAQMMKGNEKSIPPTLQPVFEQLSNQTSWLHVRWKLYRQLYGTNQRRVDLLNECAQVVFNVMQFALLDDVVLTLYRLAGPRQSKGKENMCLAQLVDGVRKCGHLELAVQLKDRLDTFGQKCKPLQARRHRWIAHCDFETALGRRPQPAVSRLMVEEALKILRDFLNEFQRHFLDATTAFERIILPSDAEGLICRLKQSVAFDDLEREGKVDASLWMNGRYKDA